MMEMRETVTACSLLVRAMAARSSIINRGLGTFRQTFKHQSSDVLHYFPVHMAKGLQQMQQRLTQVDCIVEVHDARKIPFSGRNPRFQEVLTVVRPHILVLNKVELSDEKLLSNVEAKLLASGDIKRVLFTSCKQTSNNGVKRQAEDYNVLVIGVPNVGKSSIINALRQTHMHRGGKATPVGAMPGVTRSVMEKIKVSERPKVYVFDSPGIMLPCMPNMDVAMKLALCATLKDQQVGTVNIADFMLFWLNKLKLFKYVEHFGLPEATDDIHVFLTYISKQRNLVLRIKSPSGAGYVYRPNYEHAASIALQDFRSGVLGKINLDVDFLEDQSKSCDSSVENCRTFV